MKKRALLPWLTSAFTLAACPAEPAPNPARLDLDDPTIQRYLTPIIPFEWDWQGADRRRGQLLAVAATSRHIVVAYPVVAGGMHVAWGGLDEPWRTEPLTAIGFDDVIAADAAVGPEDTVHFVFLRRRDANDPVPIVLDHLSWRAGRGVEETDTVVGKPVREQHVEATKPAVSIGVRHDGTIDVVVGHTDQHRFSSRYHQAIDHFVRRPADAWTVTRVRDELALGAVDDLELGRFARVSYDARDRPLIVHWVTNLTTGYGYGPEVLIHGDDGLFSPSHGLLINPQLVGTSTVFGDLAPYLEGYPDVWVDPEYGWIYVTPLGGRERDLSGGVTGIGVLSVGPWPVDATAEPHARRDDIIHEKGPTDMWVGGRIVTNECRGVETAAETGYELIHGRVTVGTTSRGRRELCGYPQSAPVIVFRSDDRLAGAGDDFHPPVTDVDTDDPRRSLVRDVGRTVYAHGHRAFDVAVTPLEKLVVSFGGYQVDTTDPLPWPSDDLLRIVSSDPPEGADDVNPARRELRVRVTGLAGSRDRIAWQGFDLSNGQPVIAGDVRPGANEDELVLALEDGTTLLPGIRYRVWLRHSSTDGERWLYPWQYADGGAPVFEFRTAGEPPAGTYSPDPRGVPLEVTCELCGPDPVPYEVPPSGSGWYLRIGAGEDAIDPERGDLTTFVLRDADGAAIGAEFRGESHGRVRVRWYAPLEPDSNYSITLPEDLRTVLGRRPTPEQRTLQFRTAP